MSKDIQKPPPTRTGNVTITPTELAEIDKRLSPIEGLDPLDHIEPLEIDDSPYRPPEDDEPKEQINDERGNVAETLLTPKKLTPFQQSLARLDHTDKVSFKEKLPPNSRVLTIAYRREDAEKIEQAILETSDSLGDLAFLNPLQGSKFTGATDNPKFRFATFLFTNTSSSMNIETILRKKAQGAPFITKVIPGTDVSTFRAGNSIAIFHPEAFIPFEELVKIKDKTRTKDITLPTFTPDGQPESLSPAKLAAAQEQELRPLPPESPCSFVILDPKNLKDPEIAKALKRELSLLSSDKVYMDQHNGFIVVMAAASERTGSPSRHILDRVSMIAGCPVQQWYEPGDSKTDSKKWWIEGFPKLAELRAFKDMPSSTLNAVTPEEHTIEEDDDRDDTHHQLKYGQIMEIYGIRLAEIKEIISEIKLRLGGPDKVIGFDKAIITLLEYLEFSNRNTTVVALEGVAGRGKSTLIEQVKKLLEPTGIPYLDTSLMPGQRNNPGFQIILMASQVSKSIKRQEGTSQDGPGIKALHEFEAKSEEGKIKYAMQNDYSTIKNLMLDAFEEVGQFFFQVDDKQDADRISEPLIMELIQELAERTHSRNSNINAKIIKGKRPEEYPTTKEAEVEGEIKKQGYGFIRMQVPKLNFQEVLEPEEASIGYQFIFHMLPVSERMQPNGQPKKLTNWIPLAALMHIPLDATNIKTILDKDLDKYVHFGETEITILDKTIEEIKDKIGRDSEAFALNRIREELTEQERQFMICAAMMERTKDILTVKNVIFEALGITSTKKQDDLIEELQEKGMFKGDPEKGEPLEFIHSTYSQAALKVGEDQMTSTAEVLLEKLLEPHNAKAHSPRTVFALCQYMKDSMPEDDAEFWATYTTNASEVLRQAQDFHQNDSAFQITMSILGDILELNQTTPSAEALKTLTSKRIPTTNVLQGLIQEALQSATKYGSFTGQNDTVYLAIAKLEKIHSANPHLVRKVEMEAMYKLGFEAAYVTGDAGKMGYYLEELESVGKTSKAELAYLQLKLEFKKAGLDPKKLQKVIDLCTEKLDEQINTDRRIKIKATRIKNRVKFEKFRLEETHDGEIEMQHWLLDENQIAAFISMRKALSARIQSGNLDPSDEIGSVDQLSQIYGFLGQYEEAVKSFDHLLRLASQRENHPLRVRALLLRGDARMMTARAVPSENIPHEGLEGELKRREVLDRRKIDQALEAYQKALTIIETGKIPKTDFNNLMIRSRIISANGLMCQSYARDITVAQRFNNQTRLKDIAEELSPYIEESFKLFDYINTDEDLCLKYTESEYGQGYAGFYLNQIGFSIQMFRALKPYFEKPLIPPEKGGPFMTKQAINQTVRFMAGDIPETENTPGTEKMPTDNIGALTEKANATRILIRYLTEVEAAA